VNPEGCSRSVRLRFPVVLAAIAVFTALASAPAASGYAGRFGAYYLKPPCCNGDPLNGTAAAIEVDTISPTNTDCIAFRSDAENYDSATGGPHPYLIQAGLVRCGVNANIDATCSLTNNLVKYIEIIVDGHAHCFPHGGVSITSTQMTAVQNPSGNVWYGWLSNIQYESNTFTQYFITESAELVGSNVDLCTTADQGNALFANSVNWPWLRWRQGTGWIHVQSAYLSSGCWTVYGGPPSSFNFSYPF
jgi:hypothetical protein